MENQILTYQVVQHTYGLQIFLGMQSRSGWSLLNSLAHAINCLNDAEDEDRERYELRMRDYSLQIASLQQRGYEPVRFDAVAASVWAYERNGRWSIDNMINSLGFISSNVRLFQSLVKVFDDYDNRTARFVEFLKKSKALELVEVKVPRVYRDGSVGEDSCLVCARPEDRFDFFAIPSESQAA